MADKDPIPTIGPQIPAKVRQGGDVYVPGKSGIVILRKGKRTNLNTIVGRRKKKRKKKE